MKKGEYYVEWSKEGSVVCKMFYSNKDCLYIKGANSVPLEDALSKHIPKDKDKRDPVPFGKYAKKVVHKVLRNAGIDPDTVPEDEIETLRKRDGTKNHLTLFDKYKEKIDEKLGEKMEEIQRQAKDSQKRTEDDLPHNAICCITKEVMRDPWMDNEGHSYERKAILQWLKKQQVSPKTRQLLREEDLKPNHDLRNIIHSLWTFPNDEEEEVAEESIFEEKEQQQNSNDDLMRTICDALNEVGGVSSSSWEDSNIVIWYRGSLKTVEANVELVIGSFDSLFGQNFQRPTVCRWMPL